MGLSVQRCSYLSRWEHPVELAQCIDELKRLESQLAGIEQSLT